MEYQDDKPVRVDAIVISTQHAPEVSHEQIERDLKEFVIEAHRSKELLDEAPMLSTQLAALSSEAPRGIRVLPAERSSWIPTAGTPPRRRCVLRKGSTKVDRSAAYAARYVAKNIGGWTGREMRD